MSEDLVGVSVDGFRRGDYERRFAERELGEIDHMIARIRRKDCADAAQLERALAYQEQRRSRVLRVLERLGRGRPR